ncbi:YceI family protein [Ferruginibacter sp.]
MKKTTWLLDPAHSEIFFKVKHLMITTVTGYFRKFTVTAITDGDTFDTVDSIDFAAEIDSVDTNNAQRDEHLRSADFFNAAEQKWIKFLGTKYETLSGESKLYGSLTIGGTTKPVVINVEFGGIVTDGYGQTKAGFTISGKINRKEFGLTWGAVTEAGNVVVSDEVKIHGEIQLIKQA